MKHGSYDGGFKITVIEYMYPLHLNFFDVNSEGNFEPFTGKDYWDIFDQIILSHAPYTYTVRIWAEDDYRTRRLEHFSNEEFMEILAAGKMPTIMPNFPEGKFVPILSSDVLLLELVRFRRGFYLL